MARELLESARTFKLIREPGRARVPIAKRAQDLEVKASVFQGIAKESVGKKSFSLGSNQFTLVNLTKSIDEKIIAQTIAHLAAIFKHKYIGVWAEDFEEANGQAQRFTIWVSNKAIDFSNSERELTKEEMRKMVFNVIFLVRKDELYLSNLSSEQNGAGGGALAMLYNLAKTAGMEQIKYYVTYENHKAKSFYLYNDFGTALYEDFSGTWVVKIPQNDKL